MKRDLGSGRVVTRSRGLPGKKTASGDPHRLSDSPNDRVYRPDLLLPPSLVGKVLGEFRSTVPQILGRQLRFGFVFGGFAKGYAVRDQDADFFICVRGHREATLTAFHEWYFALHARHGLTPDRKDPGEVMTVQLLEEKLRFVLDRPLRSVIDSYYEYEAIVWADAITGKRAAAVGDLVALETMTAICETLPQRWRSELLALGGASVDLETAKLPITRLFRRFVKYLKEGDNTRPTD